MNRANGRLALVLFALAAWPAAGRAAPQDEAESLGSKPFALPLARDARTTAERARGHLAAERWGEAIADLQRLLEEHVADVLPPAWRASADQPSVYASFPGAAAWARRTLGALPEPARRLYLERFEPQAALALERVRAEEPHRRRPLIELARRFPLTHAAAAAWWSLGDLELERGHLGAARLSYERASATLAAVGDSPPAGLGERLGRARSFGSAEEGGRPAGQPAAAFQPSSGNVPRGDADRWSESFELDPDPLTEDVVIDTLHQYPVLAGDRVVVNTAYHLYAVDAYSGELLWKAGPPSGWASLASTQRDELAAAIAHEDLLLAPAVAGNVVVGAMQIPYSVNPSDTWQGIDIMEAIPERRLYAFDAAGGEELWSHEPPLYWDQGRYAWNEAQGSYAQRMLVAGPPVVSGPRLFVPSYRMSGRIEYHLACYEVETGELLWATPLVSGQRETNMFGRAGKEFVASPVAVARDRVIVQTELGAVAALDLLTGEILWESLYEQIPLPRTISYQPPARNPTWRLAPPAIADGVAIATPHDSHQLVAFLLEDGRVPWSVNQRKHLPRVGSRDLQVDLLLGAQDDVVWLAGESVVALQKAGGLATPGNVFNVRWSHAIDGERVFVMPRPVLTESEVVVPLREGRMVLDRSTGNPLRAKSASWSYQEFGNVVVGDGTLYALNRAWLSGFFDWEALLERARARLREESDDPGVVGEVAELFLRRGRALEGAGEAGRALAAFEEARRLLEPQRGDGADPEVDERLFRALCSEAAVRAELGSADEALGALARARPLAPDATSLADVLLREERLLRGRDEARRRAVLDELGERCGGLPLPQSTVREGPGWLIGEALREPQELAGWEQVELPIGLWVLLTRAEAEARRFEKEAALDSLHAALARYGSLFVTSELRVGELVEERIGRRLDLDGRGVYAPFERRATELYDVAVEAHDDRLLGEVTRLYPHAGAADAARRTRLAWAFAAGDAQAAVELAYASLSRAERPGEEDALALLRAARLLGREGNAELEGLFLDALADAHGGLASDLPEHGGQTLAELAARHATEDDGWRAPPATFDAAARPAGTITQAHHWVGSLRLPPDEGRPTGGLAHVYASGKTLRAFSTEHPSEYLWPPFVLPFGESMSLAVSADRVVAGGGRTLLAVDADGAQAWRHELEGRIADVRVHRGLALVLAGPRGGPDRLFAFDAARGRFLWEVALPDAGRNGSWRPPVCDRGRGVLFVHRTSRPAGALVVDLLRGRLERDFDLDLSVGTDVSESAWVSGDTLYVPSFRRRSTDGNTLHAYGLETGGSLWSVPLPQGETLTATVSCEGRDYLVTLGLSLDAGQSGGGIYLLEDPLNGLFRQVVRFRPSESPMGLGTGRRRLELDEPLLFLESLALGSATTPVRAVRLPYGNGWTHALPVAQEELAQSGMPLPAVAADCVALAYVRASSTRSGVNDGVRLVFLDKESGVLLDRRDLDLANVADVELRGLGPALFVVATGRGPTANRIEILETQR